jgi:lipoprotein-releasing system ATP-binding protein
MTEANKTDTCTVLSANNLSKRYLDGAGASKLDVTVLRDVSLSVQAGDTVAIVGASGSGKSTLLHLLGGLDLPSSGSAQLMGRDWASMAAKAQGDWRNRHLGFVYQFHHLLPELSAVENVAMPLRIRGQSAAMAQAPAAAVLQQVGLGERLQHRPSEMSGGERQRVALARALVTRPSCILADEPTGNLDTQSANAVFDLLLQLASSQGTALVMVTHAQSLAQRCARRLLLQGGALINEG